MSSLMATDCPILRSLLAARLIGYGEFYTAQSICHTAGETHPWPRIALALACRGLSLGLVCIEPGDALARIREAYCEVWDNLDQNNRDQHNPDQDGVIPAPGDLPWPDAQTWIERVVDSVLVRSESNITGVSPLVWSGGFLYLDRYYYYQCRLAEDLRSRASVSLQSTPDIFRDPHPISKPNQKPFPDPEPTPTAVPDALRVEFNRQFPTSVSSEVETGSLDRQRLAACMALWGRLTVITGGPGTGKTTVAAKILRLLLVQSRFQNPLQPARIALAAPTGKAAMRLQESLQANLQSLALSDANQGTDQKTDQETDREFGEKSAQESHFASMLDSPLSAQTLHRLLRPLPGPGTGSGSGSGLGAGASASFYWNRDNPLPYDVVIVDEASMISLAMMSHLLAAVPQEARLILLGDKDQLASVEAGAVLGDLSLASVHDAPRFSTKFCRLLSTILSASEIQSIEDDALAGSSGIEDCVVALNRYYRFAEGSTIGRFARAMSEIDEVDAERSNHQIQEIIENIENIENRGRESIQLMEPSGGSGELSADIMGQIVEGYQPYIAALRALQYSRSNFETSCQRLLEAFSRFQVLCAHRSGPFGVESVNRQIEEALTRNEKSLRCFDRWYVGRPILIIENDYELNLFNGDIGVVMPESPGSSKRMAVFFDPQGNLRSLGTSRLPNCETVFAMSIHKSQGSQFEHVAVCLPLQSSSILSRELIYTAITRARQRVTLVAKREILEQALHRKVRRPSGLRQQLWGAG